jgi:cyclopropane fatty-acyl-phospholipid synthase-like methyltransferase
MIFAQKKHEKSMTAYWANKAHGLHRVRSEDWLQKYAEEILAIISRRGVLFDVGCGACEVTSYLAPHFDKIYGIDFSDSMLQAAHQRIDRLGIANIDLLKGTMTKFPQNDRRPHVILSYAVIQYLVPAEFIGHLRACRSVLERDGVVFVGLVPDPARKQLFYARLFPDRSNLRRRIDIYRYQIAQYFKNDPILDGMGNWYSPSDIKRFAGEAGFETEIHKPRYADYRFHAVLRLR